MTKQVTHELKPLVFAGFSGMYLLTKEPEELEKEIVTLCSTEGWQILAWDCARGVRLPREDRALPRKAGPVEPLEAMESVEGQGPKLILLYNYHRFLDNPLVVQRLANALVAGKAEQKFYLILSPVVVLPPELEKALVLLEHRLPDDSQLRDTANKLQGLPLNTPVPPAAIAAARGLTRREAEDAFALSLYEEDALSPEVIWGVKVQSVAKKGHLEVYRGKEGFSSLGGLQGLKGFGKSLLTSTSGERARGLLLLGPPGVGKSQFCKALGNECGRPTLLLDMGRLYAKHVGVSEENVREALAMADSMSPCILFVDEAEKGLAGVGSEGDSGVSSRIFGTLLSWMNDHESDVMLVCTTNDISKLPPAFSRAERFDGTFMIDLPDYEGRQKIWSIYGEQYLGWLHGSMHAVPDSEGMTGAEIKSCCRLAKLLGKSLAEAARHVVPVSVSARSQIEELREWASGRVLSAATGEVYVRPITTTTSTEAGPRKVERKAKQ